MRFRKFLLVLLALCCSVLCIAAFASCNRQTKGLLCVKKEDYAMVTGYEGDSTKVVITGKYSGEKIEVIYTDAFSGNDTIVEVVIGDDVEWIYYSAFVGCPNLESVTIGKGVKWIEPHAFFDCPSLKRVTFATESQLGLIGKEAFARCSALQEVSFQTMDNLKIIEEKAFDGCTSLRDVTFAKNSRLSTIEKFAFRQCNSLTELTLPDSLETIGWSALSGCTGLERLTLPFIGPKKNLEDNDNARPFGYIFGTEANGECVEVKQTVPLDGLPNYWELYYIPKRLKVVTVTGGVITRGAFENCTNLLYVTLPSSLTYCARSVFANCTNLRSVSFGENSQLQGIDSSFYGCNNLTRIEIPENVTKIEGGTFTTCTQLIEVYNKSQLNIIAGKYTNGNVGLYAKNIYTPTSGVSKLSVDANGYICYKDGATVILVGYLGKEKALVLPKAVTEVYAYAFYQNTELVSVQLPDSVASIGEFAFFGCSSLTDVTFKGTVANWSAIVKSDSWSDGVPATEVSCTDGVVSLIA